MYSDFACVVIVKEFEGAADLIHWVTCEDEFTHYASVVCQHLLNNEEENDRLENPTIVQ